MYVFLADGFEEIEALAPVDVMRRAGLAVTTVSVTNNQIVIGAHGIPVVADAMFDELNYTDASLLFLPGGLPGATNLEAHAGLCQLLTAKATQEDVVISAICAAPLVLGGLGLLNGKRATCYPGFEEHLKGADIQKLPVVCDQNVITAMGMGASIPFGLAIVAYFKGSECAERIKAAIFA